MQDFIKILLKNIIELKNIINFYIKLWLNKYK